MVHSILFIQLTCLTVLSNNLFPGPLWFSPWSSTLNFILHAFLHPIIIIFSQHMPIPTQPVLLQYQCYVITPSLSLSSLLGSLSFSLTPHIHLTILISARWSATTFSFLTGQVSLPWGSGVVICLDRCADLHMAQLMPLPPTVSCFSKIQIGFIFLVPAYPSSPGQRAIKQVCVCVECYQHFWHTATKSSAFTCYIHDAIVQQGMALTEIWLEVS